MNTRSSHGEICKAVDLFRFGGPGAFSDGTEGHRVLGVVLGREL